MSNQAQTTVQDRINALKKSHQDAVIGKTKCETQLDTARTNLANVEQQCAARGLTPDKLADKLAELQTTITEKLVEAEGLLPQGV
jgi:hypothetical protein